VELDSLAPRAQTDVMRITPKKWP